MFEWLFNGALHILLSVVPTWVWVIVAGLGVGWAWKTFGKEGVVGAVVAILTLGAYRQGWRDRGAGKAPIVPVGDEPRLVGRAKVRRTAKRDPGKRVYDADTNTWVEK